jgi:hypothetical protein
VLLDKPSLQQIYIAKTSHLDHHLSHSTFHRVVFMLKLPPESSHPYLEPSSLVVPFWQTQCCCNARPKEKRLSQCTDHLLRNNSVSDKDGNIWIVLVIYIEKMREIFSSPVLGKMHGEILYYKFRQSERIRNDGSNLLLMWSVFLSCCNA